MAFYITWNFRGILPVFMNRVRTIEVEDPIPLLKEATRSVKEHKKKLPPVVNEIRAL